MIVFNLNNVVFCLLKVSSVLLQRCVEFGRLKLFESNEELVGLNNLIDIASDVVKDLTKFPLRVVEVGFSSQPVSLNFASVSEPCCNTFFFQVNPIGGEVIACCYDLKEPVCD